MRRGISLVSVLAAIVVIVFLIALMFPGIESRGTGRHNVCENNLRQIALAMHIYESSFKCLPPGAFGAIAPDATNPSANVGMWGWATLILPHLERNHLSKQFALRNRGLNDLLRSAIEADLREMKLPEFICTSDPGDIAVRRLRIGGTGSPTKVAHASYVGCAGANPFAKKVSEGQGAFGFNRHMSIGKISSWDGASTTLLLSERAITPGRAAVWLGYTSTNPSDGDGYSAVLGSTSYRMNDGWAGEANPTQYLPQLAFSSNHPGGSNVAFAPRPARTLRGLG